MSDSRPEMERLPRLSEVLGVSSDYLLLVPDDPRRPRQAASAEEARFLDVDRADYATLRLSLRAAAGEPVFEEPDPDGLRLAFRRDWLKRWCGDRVDERCVYLTRVAGDSMVPTIPDGSIALVLRWYPPEKDSGLPLIEDGRIYLVQVPEDDGHLTEAGRTVKRLTLDPVNGMLIVASDNPRYRPFTLPLRDRDLRRIILGRVVWYAVTEE